MKDRMTFKRITAFPAKIEQRARKESADVFYVGFKMSKFAEYDDDSGYYIEECPDLSGLYDLNKRKLTMISSEAKVQNFAREVVSEYKSLLSDAEEATKKLPYYYPKEREHTNAVSAMVITGYWDTLMIDIAIQYNNYTFEEISKIIGRKLGPAKARQFMKDFSKRREQQLEEETEDKPVYATDVKGTRTVLKPIAEFSSEFVEFVNLENKDIAYVEIYFLKYADSYDERGVYLKEAHQVLGLNDKNKQKIAHNDRGDQKIINLANSELRNSNYSPESIDYVDAVTGIILTSIYDRECLKIAYKYDKYRIEDVAQMISGTLGPEKAEKFLEVNISYIPR